MKKLLGGIFARPQSSESPRTGPSGGDIDASSFTVKQWGDFFVPRTSRLQTLPAVDQETLEALDAALRSIVVHIKAVLAKMLTQDEADLELRELAHVGQQVAGELQLPSDEMAPSLLKSYFSTSLGLTLCEQTAFPSLVLDFVAKMRVIVMKDEFCGMMKQSVDANKTNVLPTTTNDIAPVLSTRSTLLNEMLPVLHLLMDCVVAFAANETLMEKFRCELPNLIALTAEDYPLSAVFIRDCSSRALESVPERNFNAGLAWYLLDCKIIAKTVDCLIRCVMATAITPSTAERAMQLYLRLTAEQVIQTSCATGIDDAATAAAVSDALGLSRTGGHSSDCGESSALMLSPKKVLDGDPHSDRKADLSASTETFCLPSYNVQVGLKAVVYVLERTYRFTLVLLDEFQMSGGYMLLLRLLDTCSEEEIPGFLHILTMLIPLGPRSGDNYDSVERATSGNVLGARNVAAFSTMRDLLLNCLTSANSDVETLTEVNAKAQGRTEHLILQLLTQVLHIYTSDYDNFVYLEPKTRTLALLLTKVPYTRFYDAQVIILRIVEYVCCAANPEDSLPHEILSVVCGSFLAFGPLSCHANAELPPLERTPQDLLRALVDGPPSTLSLLMCECLIRILRNADGDRYKHELSGFGLMDRGIYVSLVEVASCLAAIPENDVCTRHKVLAALKLHLALYCELTCLMLRHNIQECVRFRQAKISQSLYTIARVLVSSDIFATPFDTVYEIPSCPRGVAVMSIFSELAAIVRYASDNTATSQGEILVAGVESDISSMLELLQSFRGAIWRQMLLLDMLMDILKAGGTATAPLWKSCQGYEMLVALLSSLDLNGHDSPELAFRMMELVLEVFSATLDVQHGGNENAEYLRSIDGYSTIASCIITSNVMQSVKREAILQRISALISGGASRCEIYNGDAVQLVFQLLPTLPESDAIDTMTKLLSMLDSASIVKRKEQVKRLVRAGAFEWMDSPELIAKVRNTNDPLSPLLLKWLVATALEEDLELPRLYNVLKLVGKTMPKLLNSPQHGSNDEACNETSEPGLLLLQNLLHKPVVRHICVGRPQGDGQTGRYVQIANSADRVWPPSSGYSFACWFYFPPVLTCDAVQADTTSKSDSKTAPESSTPSPLYEGFLSLLSDDPNKHQMDVYGVLVGPTLTLFASLDAASRKEDVIEELQVTEVARDGPLEWSVISETHKVKARCDDVESVDLWWHAMTQCCHPRNCTELDQDVVSDDALLCSFRKLGRDEKTTSTSTADFQRVAEEGSACLVSIYSQESPGCFVRAFFEQSTGFLRFHTGALSSGPNINPMPKRTSVVFEDVSIDALRPAGDAVNADRNDVDGSHLKCTEQERDWHHFAFTHRKAVVGSSLMTVYIDGLEVGTKKLSYPSASSVGSYQAFVGSDAQVCSPHSALSWKVGPTWLTDEVLSSSTIAGLFSLGSTFAHQLGSHAYRSVGDWPEALASSYFARAADRGIPIARFADHCQLPKLGRTCRRHWRDSNDANNAQSTSNDAVAASTATIAESMIAKREEFTEGIRVAGGMSLRKGRNTLAAFRSFVNYDCAMSSYGLEIESQLRSCSIPEDTILMTLNTFSSDRSSTSVLMNTRVHYINCAQSNGLDFARSLPSVGGISQVLFPLLDNATRRDDFGLLLQLLHAVLRRNPSCLAECIGSNGYMFLAALLCSRMHLIDEKELTWVVRLAVAGKLSSTATNQVVHPVIVDAVALSHLVLNAELRKHLPHPLQCQLVSLLMDLLVVSNPNALFNARQLRRAGLVLWILAYLTDLGNADCNMNEAIALEMQWCFPKFIEPTYEAILQYVLSLLRAFLRIESHVSDFNDIGELLSLSMTSTVLHRRTSPIRIILLQFVLHEIENDEGYTKSSTAALDEASKQESDATQRFSDAIVDAITYRERPTPARRREDKRVDNGNSLETASLGSPLADTSVGGFAPGTVDGFANVLLEVIEQDFDDKRWVAAEGILTVRILLSLAQSSPTFADYLLHQTVMVQKLKRVLRKYNTDYRVYIPLLAYISETPIGTTSYDDLEPLSAPDLTSKPFTVTKPLSIGRCIDHVWDLIGCLLLENCRESNKTVATEVAVTVLKKIAFLVTTSPSFYSAVCRSSGTLFRIISRCLLDASASAIDPSQSSPAEGPIAPESSDILCKTFQSLTQSVQAEMSPSNDIADACVHLIHVIMTQALTTADDFGSLMMLLLDVFDETILKQQGSLLSRLWAQKFWLTLLTNIIEQQKVLTSAPTFISIRNTCTVCVALARYIADDDSHHVHGSRTDSPSSGDQEGGAEVPSTLPHIDSIDSTAVACFGVEVLYFLLKCSKLCAEPVLVQALGVDEQQFFYGSLVYCTQIVMLNELSGVHGNTAISESILACLLDSKHLLLQRPSWQSVIVSGIGAQSTTNDSSSGLDANVATGRPSRRLYRGRSLSANAFKEYGIGVESDRNFLLVLAAQLYRMLMDDSASTRYTAIVMWQVLIDQRFDVLKELLIAEPRPSVLQTITSTKKETAVDIFHGGFDRLLYALHTPDDAQESLQPPSVTLNQEIWCQFQLWLAENDALLTDLIIARTEAIQRHVQDVLSSCICLRKSSSTSGPHDLCLDTNFPVRLGLTLDTSPRELSNALDLDRRDMLAKKVLIKYTSLRDSVADSMYDGFAQWRQSALRLACTRNIWQTGKWQIDPSEGSDYETMTEFKAQRSVFQRRSCGYRLDTTEGPQRMRLRLVRDYSLEEKTLENGLTSVMSRMVNESKDRETESETTLADNSQWSLLLSRKECTDTDPFRRSLVFHEAVEAFREFAYQQATTTNRTKDTVPILEHILSRCRMDSTHDLSENVESSRKDDHDAGNRPVLAMARALYSTFLDNAQSGKPSLGVSPSIVSDIYRVIEDAEAHRQELLIVATLFDAADAEATQSALCGVRRESISSLRLEPGMLPEDTVEVEDDESDHELNHEIPLGSGSPMDTVESDDSDGRDPMEETGLTDPLSAVQDTVGMAENGLIDASTSDLTSPRSEPSKRIDTSSDAVYGVIARFLRRDDYPPMRSYKAMNIVGMGGTLGVVLLCRFGLYFIGGYTKLYNNQLDESKTFAKSALVRENGGAQPSFLASTPRGRMTTTKLRAALTDFSVQFASSKANGERSFTVVPLPGLPEETSHGVGTSRPFGNSRWNIKYSNVKQFCRIKYQLRPVGIELFDTFGSTYFLQLDTLADREELIKFLFQMPLVNSIFWSPVLRTGALVPSVKRIRQTVTKRWLRGSMTNFEYLIHLNTLAGRSFNDITQYPVFPWILADYTSDFLALDAHETYRDLSKPMGAIGATRAAQFRERYLTMSQDMDIDDLMETPAFHYGTHYSCSAYVINYLIRLEPFTALALELQGGEFDHPDRLFRSIPSSWTSASSDNFQDVRELIPEFFYLPEFLYNANKCKFGTTQSGEEVCHVILPPWAYGDPREFVRLNRRALESKYVSEHLHEWIDLIFGAKQTGQAAVDAQNVFMHFTYEGTVDIEQITDPVMRAATLAQIENFGQTPSRLFSSPHPQRKVPTLLSTTSTGGSTIETSSSQKPSGGHQYDGIAPSTMEAYVKWHTPLAPALVAIGKDYVLLKKHSMVAMQGAIGDVKLVNDKMHCQSLGCIFMPPRFAKYLEWGNCGGVMKLRVHQQSSSASRYRESNKVLAVIEGAHHDFINCAAVSEDGALLVTGGRDAVVNLIECSKASDGRRVFNQVAKLVGHSDAVACVAINKGFNLIASSSADRSVLLWDLRTRALLQELAGHSTTIIHVSINSANGNILTATNSELRLWSINGDLLAASSSSAFGLQAITCAISTRCESWQNGVIAVTGHANGAIALWGLRYPSDLARQKDTGNAEVDVSTKLNWDTEASSSSKCVDSTNSLVSIQRQGISSKASMKVTPSCQLFILKLLLDHRSKVTALTLGPEQRQLLSGDVEGNCIRWVDDSIGSNIH